MREILFRGKTNSGEWVYGYYIFSPAIRNAKGQTISPTDFDSHHIVTKKFNAAREINPETVGQYTGLTDKNGNKIFEGDIVRYKNTEGAIYKGKKLTVIGKVVYNDKTASFAVDGKDEIGAKYYDYFPIRSSVEIIGNIHDNPELLKGGEG